MVNYKDGKIYKIFDLTTNKYYIGGTAQLRLCKRLTQHVCDYKNYLKGKQYYITSFEVIKNNNYKILLICNYSCNNKEELSKEEYKYPLRG